MPNKETEEHDSDVLESSNNKQQSQGDNDNTDIMSMGPSNSASKTIEWSPENELIMVEWCDVAQCYKWLNTRSHQIYAYMNAWFTIPAIVLSTISGTASFAQTSLPAQYQVYSPMAIGAINIFIGILTTVQQYLKIAELNEAHRVSSISWDKFARNIRIELAKKPDERMDAGHFLKLNRQEFDRLMETSPTVNDKVIKEFNAKFQGKPGSPERKRFDELRKPDICDTIISANETRHHWYLDLNKQTGPIELDTSSINEQLLKSKEEALRSKNELIKLQQLKINEKENAIKQKQQEEIEELKRELEMAVSSKKIIEEHEKEYKEKSRCLDDYVAKFEDMYARKPMSDEIKDNMGSEVDQQVLARFLLSYLADENV
jgi:hypothetical protein